MDSFWNDPAIRPVIIALIIAGGGALTVVITRIGAKLGQLIDELKVTRTELSAVAITTTKTETLVNSQRSELRAENDLLKQRIDAMQLTITLASETAAKVASQTASDTAAALALSVATRPIALTVTTTGGAEVLAIPAQSVTMPEQTVPVEDAPSPVRIIAP